MSNLLSAGIGGTTPTLAAASPLLMNQRVWFVDSQTGNTSYSGKDRKSPKATIAQAVAAISTNDDHIIVCLSGHTEEVSTTITLGQRITLIGEGSSGGTPTVKLTMAATTNDTISITAARCEISGIHFQPPGQAASPGAATASFISGAVSNVWIRECHFDCDEHSDGPGVDMQSGANDWFFQNCIFTSTEATVGSLPDSALRTAAAITGLRLEGCAFDGGTVGFEDSSGNPWAFDGSAAAITALRVVSQSLLAGADMKLHSSTTGYINPQTTSGHAKLEW